MDESNNEYFAELDQNNVVLRILVVGKNVLVDEQGNQLEFPESEPVGQQFLISLFGPSTWKQTDYIQPVTYRGEPAAVGGKYDPVEDKFYIPLEPAVESDSDIQPSQLF
jgi:hypothetical protein